MTYNFDPDRWYENELRALRRRAARGEIDADTLHGEMQALDLRYEQMLNRLDGTYQLPGFGPD